MSDSKNLIIAPSLLGADFSKLRSEVELCNDSKAEWLHLDIMDQQFVPNLSFGPAVVKSLRNHSDLFFDVSSILYELEPSAYSAYQMSKMSIKKGELSNAIKFAKQAVEAEEDKNTKATYFLNLADAYRISGSYTSARRAVYDALDLRNNWGEAYLNLGNIYVAGAKSCGNTDFDNKTVYWVAVDAFRKALSDVETKDRAAKSINTYSKYFPTKENCFFNGIADGSSHTVECWINQTTNVRTSD